MKAESIWTPVLAERLTELWNSGRSAQGIARDLGVSKNAVVSKAHRLGLPGRPSPLKSPPRRHAIGPGSAKCTWPIGFPGDPKFRFCGKPVTDAGASYCPRHHDLTHWPRTAKRHG